MNRGTSAVAYPGQSYSRSTCNVTRGDADDRCRRMDRSGSELRVGRSLLRVGRPMTALATGLLPRRGRPRRSCTITTAGSEISPRISPRRSPTRTKSSSRCPMSARRNGIARTPRGSSRRSCSRHCVERYAPFDPAYAYLFNSYYEAVGPRHPRPQRGLLSRPSVDEIARYRAHVDDAMHDLIDDVRRRGRRAHRARPASRTAAPRAVAHGHQARAALQPDRSRLRARAAHAPHAPTRAALRDGARRQRRDRSRRPRVLLRQRDARATSCTSSRMQHRRPARVRRRVARVHRRRRVPPARALALRRLVRGAGERVGRAALLARRRRRRLERLHARRAARARPERTGRARQPLRSRRVRALARRAPARPSSSGSTRRGARRRERCASSTTSPGSGRRARTSPIRAFGPRPARSASTTASS